MPARDDDAGMGGDRDHTAMLLSLYDHAVGEVFAFIQARCLDRHVAHELTADTFLAAVGQTQRGAVNEVTTAWLIGIARHKLIDHWRRQARRVRTIPLSEDFESELVDDPWDVVIDTRRVAVVLDAIGPHHRSALTLRYIDGLGVPEVAHCLDRSVEATETLLVRARKAFRSAYERSEQ
jgi:RNA polymerase sigma-70 factor, ECF subfamily